MSRILALDYGNKRVGIAVTDPGRLIATLLETVETHKVMDFLTDYIKREQVGTIVLGNPKTLNNQPSESVKYIKPFTERLKKAFPDLFIDFIDERFTSKLAFQTMIDAGLGKKRRQDKGLVDGISAVILLQSYLDLLQTTQNRNL